MKKSFSSAIAVSSLFAVLTLAFSCSNTQESKLVYTENNTIKQSVKEKEQEITWTLELEGERLSETINRNSMQLGSDVPFGKDIYKINSKNSPSVYPSISEFGSLDTRDLKLSVKQKLNGFCEALSAKDHANADSFFSKKYIFNYVFFIKDFEDGWKKNFDKPLPSEDKAFTKWLFGEPFNGADIIQIPVRFYADCGTIDMTVFINSKGNNEFYQITIDRWKKV